VPDVAEQLELVGQLRSRARRHLAGRLDRETSWLAGIRSRPALASPAGELTRRQEQVLALAERARRCIAATLDRAGGDMIQTRARLVALSPAATLRRGYAIVQQADATVVRAAAQVSPGEPLTIRFAEDQLAVTSATSAGGTPARTKVGA
jgi:exodeoxyribonuclease VII large subunit